MVDRDVGAGLEGDPVHLVRGEEDAVVQDAVELEVGAHLGLVDVVLRLAHLFGVEVPVRGGEREAALRRVDLLLDPGRLAARLGGRRGDEVVHQLVRVLGRLRHLVVEDVVRVGLEAEQLRLLRAQLRQARHDGRRVVLAAVVAALLRGREDLLAQGAVRQRGEHRLLRRVLEREDPLAVELALLRGFGGGGERRPSVAPASFFLSETTGGGGVGVGQELFLELGVELGLLLVERHERLLVGVGEVRARADEREVVPLDEVLRLGIEPERRALRVDRLDARVELRVQVDGVVERGQLRRDLGLDLLDRLVRVGLLDVGEHLVGARQQHARLLHRLDRVREGGGRGVVRDRLHLGALDLHAFLDRRLVVRDLDPVEGRRLEGQRARRGEGVGGGQLRERRQGGEGEDRGEGEGPLGFHHGLSVQGLPVSTKRP